MGIWESEYYMNSDPGPVCSIWYCRPWHPTNPTWQPFGNPGHSCQLVQELSQSFKVAVDSKHSSPRELKYGLPRVMQWGKSFHLLLLTYWRSNCQLHYTDCICWWPLHMQQFQSRCQGTITQSQNRPRENIHTSKTMDGYEAPEAKPQQNRIHPLWLPTTTQEDITGTTLYPRWSYCSKQSGEIPRRISWPKPKLQETHKRENQKSNGQHNKNLCQTEVSNISILHHTHTDALHNPSWLCQCNALWSTIKHTKKIPDHTRHLHKTCPQQKYVLKLIMGTKETALGSHSQRIEHKILMTCKCITGIASKYLQDLINIKNNTQDNMWSNNTGTILHIPKWSTRPLQHGPSCTLLQHCGTNYQDASEIHQTWTSSKKRLKTHLFCQAYN